MTSSQGHVWFCLLIKSIKEMMDWSLLCTFWNNHCSEWNVTSCSFKHKQHLCATEMSVKEWRFTIYRTTGASGNSGFHHCKLKFHPFPSYTRSQASSLIPWTFFSIIISLQTHGIDIQSSQPQNFETLFSNFPPCLSWFETNTSFPISSFGNTMTWMQASTCICLQQRVLAM